MPIAADGKGRKKGKSKAQPRKPKMGKNGFELGKAKSKSKKKNA